MLIGLHSFNVYKCELKSKTSVCILTLFISTGSGVMSSGLHQRSILMADADRDRKKTQNGEQSNLRRDEQFSATRNIYGQSATENV